MRFRLCVGNRLHPTRERKTSRALFSSQWTKTLGRFVWACCRPSCALKYGKILERLKIIISWERQVPPIPTSPRALLLTLAPPPTLHPSLHPLYLPSLSVSLYEYVRMSADRACKSTRRVRIPLPSLPAPTSPSFLLNPRTPLCIPLRIHPSPDSHKFFTCARAWRHASRLHRPTLPRKMSVCTRRRTLRASPLCVSARACLCTLLHLRASTVPDRCGAHGDLLTCAFACVLAGV